jgi:hypothetical protein
MNKIIPLIIILASCGESPKFIIEGYEIIDSVRVINPGEPYPFQPDRIYYGYTPEGTVISTRNREIKVGDSVAISKQVKP